MYKIFGREPALWASLFAIAIKMISAFWLHVSIDDQARINATVAAVIGVLVAVSVRDGVSAAVLGLVQAAIALGVGFGLHWTADQQALVMSAAAAIAAMFVRTQVTARVTRAQLGLAA